MTGFLGHQLPSDDGPLSLRYDKAKDCNKSDDKLDGSSRLC